MTVESLAGFSRWVRPSSFVETALPEFDSFWEHSWRIRLPSPFGLNPYEGLGKAIFGQLQPNGELCSKAVG